jgi:hypothetical protein
VNLSHMGDKTAGLIGTAGIVGTLTVETLNTYAALFIAILTIVILLPKAFAALSGMVSRTRSRFMAWRRLRESRNETADVPRGDNERNV